MTRLAAGLAALLWMCAATVILAQSTTTPRTTPQAQGTLRTRTTTPPPPQPQDTIRANPRPPQLPDDKRTPPPPPPPPSDIPSQPDRNPSSVPGTNPAIQRGTIIQRPRTDPDPGTPDDTTTPAGTTSTATPTTPGAAPPTPPERGTSTESDEASAAEHEIPGELLIVAQSVEQAEAQRQWFSSQGIGVLRRRTLSGLRWVLTVYRVPPGTDVPALLQSLLATWPDALGEPNRRYLPLDDDSRAEPASERTPSSDRKQILYASAMISLPPQGCASRVRIAMLDGPVNPSLPAFSAHRIQTVDIADLPDTPRYDHASGIAALWLGDGADRGVVPNAELFAANVFGERDGKPFTTTEWVVRGLDWVLGLPNVPPVVNLSFGGPSSNVLARAIERVQERARVIAAGGNDGKSEPVYPAALPGVIGVTAVDARRKRWTSANSGEHIAIAAPGVDVWTIDGAGRGYYASGTSFASAFVTAALAIRTPRQDDISAWLQRHTVDLGTAGRDPQFGFGLLHANGFCN